MIRILHTSFVVLLLTVISFVTVAAKADEIDYARDVAPILIEQCQMCHRENGIAPWAMSNYQVVQAFAPAIKAYASWTD
jgi:hypothetical protein